jgi:organic hydroperoxide reductase OsmC/OhrA
MKKEHHYKVTTHWEGNRGTGTSSVSAYDRIHTASMEQKPDLKLTTDNALYGNKTIHNPEDLLLTALSSCHMLSYLYVCAIEGVVITGYTDNATGIMVEDISGGGHFTEVTLNPTFTVADSSMIEKAIALHHKASEVCYIANSVNFPVKHHPTCSNIAD